MFSEMANVIKFDLIKLAISLYQIDKYPVSYVGVGQSEKYISR